MEKKKFKLERSYKKRKFLTLQFDDSMELCLGLSRILSQPDMKGVVYKITVQQDTPALNLHYNKKIGTKNALTAH